MRVGVHGGTRALVVEGVRKAFGSARVLEGVSLRVEAGEFVTLLGPSGCGKTTLLRIIGGFEEADSGSVRLGEMELLGVPANRRPVNTVFQSYALFPHLSVEGNVGFGLKAMGVERGEVRRRVGAAMEMLRIGELAKRKPAELSGGQKQRVALARAVVCEPEVLLLDEPMSALDAKLRAEVQGELRRLQKRLGKSFVLVTHDQDEAMGVSDRVLVMNGGRIEQEGTPAEVYEKPRTRFVATFLGAANVVEARRIGPAGSREVMTEWGMWRTREGVDWERGWVSVRPERVELSDPGSGGEWRVEEVVFRGDHREVRVAREAGHALKARTSREMFVGDYVEVRVANVEVLEGESDGKGKAKDDVTTAAGV